MANIYETFDSSPILADWAFDHQPAESLIWASGVAKQVSWMRAVAPNSRCISTHRSKSVTLPVAAWRKGDRVVVLRDNFHDINVAVIGSTPIFIPLGYVHTIVDTTWLSSEKARAAEYSGLGIDDPKFSTDAWLEDWSGATLIRADGSIAVARRAFAQGIECLPGVSLDPYRPGSSAFITSTNPERAAALVGLLLEDTPKAPGEGE